MSCNFGILEQRFSLAFRDFLKMPEGHVTDTHGHKYNHVLELYYGELQIDAVRSDGTKACNIHKTLDGVPVRVEIAKGIPHKITVLMDATSFSCAFSHRFWDGEESERFEGNLGATN